MQPQTIEELRAVFDDKMPDVRLATAPASGDPKVLAENVRRLAGQYVATNGRKTIPISLYLHDEVRRLGAAPR
jgi:hypothetical protein